MKTLRGEIVMCDFPYSDMSGSKRRPALVVMDVMDNAYQKLDHTTRHFQQSCAVCR